jgi:hypothetical protein
MKWEQIKDFPQYEVSEDIGKVFKQTREEE